MRSLAFLNVKFSHLQIKFIGVFSLVRGHDAAAGTCPAGHCGWTTPQLSGASSPQPGPGLKSASVATIDFPGKPEPGSQARHGDGWACVEKKR